MLNKVRSQLKGIIYSVKSLTQQQQQQQQQTFIYTTQSYVPKSLHYLPINHFSKFGTKERKILDLTKQLNTFAKKHNLKQMIATQIKIIKLKELIGKNEFYPNFLVDYKQLCEYLIQKRDFEEAITLYIDCIKHYQHKIEQSHSSNTQTNQQDNHENKDMNEQNEQYKQDVSDLIDLQLDYGNVQLVDGNRNGDEAFEIIESLKERQREMSALQRIRHIYLESKMYYKTYELNDSLTTLAQADDIIKQLNDNSHEQSIKQPHFLNLQVELITLRIQILVELQQIQFAEQLIAEANTLIEKNGLHSTNPIMCFHFYTASLEVYQHNANFEQAQIITIQIQSLLETSLINDPLYQSIVFYYDSLLMNSIGRYIESAQSIRSSFESLEKTVNCEYEIVWKALNLKAVQMIQENDFKNAIQLLLTNKKEMEKQERRQTRLYYETLVHIAVLQYALTNLDKATELAQQLKEGVIKHFGQSSELYSDALLLQGLCLLSQNQQSSENINLGVMNIRQACMYYKNNQTKQQYIRVLCLNLLKEVLKKKQGFKEILYINTVLDKYYFQPRLSHQKTEEFITSYEENCKQTEAISTILNLHTISKQ